MINYDHKHRTIFCFLLPMTACYLAFVMLPILGSFYLAFQEWNGVQGVPLRFVGLENFRSLLDSSDFAQSIANILWFVVLSVLLQISIGFLMAFLIFEARRGVRFFKAAYFIPMILPITATSVLWRVILYPNNSGLLNKVLSLFTGNPDGVAWLVESGTALNSLIVVTAWGSFGYYMIIGLAALMNISKDIIEAAIIDGANKRHQVFFIMVPLIKGAIGLSVVMVITGILKMFDVIFVMTEGGPAGMTHVPATLMYNEAFKFNNFGLGSAIAVVIFLMSLVMTVLSLTVVYRNAE